MIAAGGGNDTVSYYGTESSIDGGTGTNTLVLKAAGDVNLGNADQTRRRFDQRHQFPERRCVGAVVGGVDHRLVSAPTRSPAAPATTRSTARGGADVIAAGGGNDTVTYRGTETSIDGGAGTDTLVLAASGGTTAVNLSVRPAPTRPPATASASPISRTSTPRRSARR